MVRMSVPRKEANAELSRRHVLRVGAWSVPAVVIAATAPMSAGSGLPTIISASTAQARRYAQGNARRVQVDISVAATGGDVTQATVTVGFELANVNAGAYRIVTSGGWLFVAELVTATQRQFVFRYSGVVAASSVSPTLVMECDMASQGNAWVDPVFVSGTAQTTSGSTVSFGPLSLTPAQQGANG